MPALPMTPFRLTRAAALALLTLSPTVTAAQCGGAFGDFVTGLKDEAINAGYAIKTVNGFFKGVAQDPKVLKADRAQGVFQKPFIEFSRRLISQDRLVRGQRKAQELSNVFDRIESTYGINRGVLFLQLRRYARAVQELNEAFQRDQSSKAVMYTLYHNAR